MDHTPFIIGAYGAAAIIFAWCAIAPLLRERKLRAQLARAHAAEGRRKSP